LPATALRLSERIDEARSNEQFLVLRPRRICTRALRSPVAALLKCLSSNASASWCCTLLSDLLAADTTSALRWPNASSRCAIMHGVPRFPIATTELRSLGSGFPALPVCQKGQFLCHCRSNRDSDYLCNHQCRAQELLRVEVLVLTWIRRYSIVSFPQRNLSSRSAWPHSSRNSALPANHDMRRTDAHGCCVLHAFPSSAMRMSLKHESTLLRG